MTEHEDERLDIKYKSVRHINGKLRRIIVDEYDNIINRDPTNEEIKLIIDERHRPKKCCFCRTTGDINIRYIRHKCSKKDCTKILCYKCWDEYYRKNDPGSHPNLVKSITNIRTGNLDRNSELGKSIIDQAIVAKVLSIEDLNIKKNNFGYYIDLNHWKLGRIDVKGSIPRYCLMKLTITRNASKCSIYDKFEIKDIEIYNNTHHSIISFLGNRKYFGIDDIKEWMMK